MSPFFVHQLGQLFVSFLLLLFLLVSHLLKPFFIGTALSVVLLFDRLWLEEILAGVE